MILDLLAKDYQEEEARDYLGISQIGYCSLKLVRQVLRKEKTELKPEVLGKFFRGKAIHEEIPSLIWRNRAYFREKFGLKYIKSEKEVIIKINEYELKGHLDMLFEDKTGNLVVFDWKVVNFIPKEPHQHYLDQLFMYAEAVGANKVALVYFDSENMQDKMFEMTIDKARIAFLKDKYYDIMQLIKKEKEPDKPYQHFDDSWECSYCQYKNECWSKEEIERFYTKKDVTMPIEFDLARRYANIAKEFNKLKEMKEELEEQIKIKLNGAEGVSDFFSVRYIVPEPKIDYNINAIKQKYDLKEFEILKQNKPYYKFILKKY